LINDRIPEHGSHFIWLVILLIKVVLSSSS